MTQGWGARAAPSEHAPAAASMPRTVGAHAPDTLDQSPLLSSIAGQPQGQVWRCGVHLRCAGKACVLQRLPSRCLRMPSFACRLPAAQPGCLPLLPLLMRSDCSPYMVSRPTPSASYLLLARSSPAPSLTLCVVHRQTEAAARLTPRSCGIASMAVHPCQHHQHPGLQGGLALPQAQHAMHSTDKHTSQHVCGCAAS